jgi:predicted deacylase
VQPGEHVRAGEVVARVNGVALHSPRAGLVLTARQARDVEPESPVCEIAVVAEQPSARANTFDE